MGMGALALTPIAGDAFGDATRSAGNLASPLAPKKPHFAARAKRVIHLFLNGGPSHVDTFDHKPALDKYHGKELPRSIHLVTERRTGTVLRSPFKFQRYGRSGIEVSEIFSHVGECIDDIAVIRSMQTDVPNHIPSILLMNCGDARLIRPSLGSWVTYGLGTVNQNLPGYVVLLDQRGGPISGPPNWGAGFMPATYQGTVFRTAGEPILNLRPPRDVSSEQQRRELEL